MRASDSIMGKLDTAQMANLEVQAKFSITRATTQGYQDALRLEQHIHKVGAT